MTFQPLDWVIAGLSAVMLLMGIFRGFSGIFAFVTASCATVSAGMWGWPHLAAATGLSTLMNAVLAIVIGVVVFGIVRLVVEKTVGGLLSQPADSVIGAAVAAACTAALVFAIASNQTFRQHSNLAKGIPVDVGQRVD